VLAVEPVGLDGAEEELRAVGVWAGVGHGENAWASVLEREVLVGELFAVDRLAAGTITLGEVTALAHEVCDHSVERGSGKAEALLASAECSEVFGSLWDDVLSEGHLDSAESGTVCGHVEENFGRHLESVFGIVRVASQ